LEVDLSRKFRILLVVCLSLAFILSGCTRNKATTPPKVTGPAAAVATTTFEGEGKVISLKPKLPSIEIDHQEIKGLMPAMTMEFYVKDKSMLNGLNAGDSITFTINNGVGGLVITKITKKGP
jgi:Cu(I)/Ag(I) efflux system protein CusF